MLGGLSEGGKGEAKGFGIQASNNKNERKGQRELRLLMLGRKSLFTRSFSGESDGRKTKVCYTDGSKQTPPHRGWICLLNPDVF